MICAFLGIFTTEQKNVSFVIRRPTWCCRLPKDQVLLFISARRVLKKTCSACHPC